MSMLGLVIAGAGVLLIYWSFGGYSIEGLMGGGGDKTQGSPNTNKGMYPGQPMGDNPGQIWGYTPDGLPIVGRPIQ